jgi:hypothetical protein
LSRKKAFSFLRSLPAGAIALAAVVLLFLGYFLLIRNHSSDPPLRGTLQEEIRLIKPEGKLKEAPTAFLWTDVKGRDSFRFEMKLLPRPGCSSPQK